jgi:hypothetical protein
MPSVCLMFSTKHARRAVLAVALATVPALAQHAKNTTAPDECGTRFEAADKNNDGLITRTETSDAGRLPPELTKEGFITRPEFLKACAKLLPAEAQKFDKSAPPSPHSTGLSMAPETKGKQQPQGPTGPVDTKSGGAPAESPQGQTPPGMQSAPDGSSKTIIDPDAKRQ